MRPDLDELRRKIDNPLLIAPKLREQVLSALAYIDEMESSYRKCGILPCPSCQAANERVAALEIERNALLAKQSAWWQNNNALIEEMQRLRAAVHFPSKLEGTAEAEE